MPDPSKKPQHLRAIILIRILWLLSIALSAVIIYLSWIPDSRMGLVPWLPRWLAGWADSGGGVETLRTGLALAIASFLFSLACQASGRRNGIRFSLGFGLLLVLLAEGGQFFLPARSPDWGDVAWGGLGAMAGVIAAVAILSILRKCLSKKAPTA